MGFAHHGTCSLEKYLVEQGHKVIRRENGFETLTLDVYNQNYSEYLPIFIWSEKKKDMYDIEKIMKYWKPIKPILVQLDEMADNPNFPWENKNGYHSKRGIRPVYKS